MGLSLLKQVRHSQHVSGFDKNLLREPKSFCVVLHWQQLVPKVQLTKFKAQNLTTYNAILVENFLASLRSGPKAERLVLASSAGTTFADRRLPGLDEVKEPNGEKGTLVPNGH